MPPGGPELAVLSEEASGESPEAAVAGVAAGLTSSPPTDPLGCEWAGEAAARVAVVAVTDEAAAAADDFEDEVDDEESTAVGTASSE